jgi:hypothetical protein
LTSDQLENGYDVTHEYLRSESVLGRRPLPGVLGARQAKYITGEPSCRKAFGVPSLGHCELPIDMYGGKNLSAKQGTIDNPLLLSNFCLEFKFNWIINRADLYNAGGY